MKQVKFLGKWIQVKILDPKYEHCSTCAGNIVTPYHALVVDEQGRKAKAVYSNTEGELSFIYRVIDADFGTTNETQKD